MLLPTRGEVQVACKRRIFDAGYIPSLNRDNVELTTDQAAEITEGGVTLKSGRKIEADVIVLANGFKTDGEQPMVSVCARKLTKPILTPLYRTSSTATALRCSNTGRALAVYRRRTAARLYPSFPTCSSFGGKFFFLPCSERLLLTQKS